VKLAVICLAATFAPVSARAECVSYGLEVKAAAPGTTTLPDDGGIVVYAEPKQMARLDPGDPTLVPDWKWKGSGKPTVVSLAPGLSVVKAPKARGTLHLVDGKGDVRAIIKSSDEKRKLLAAPQPKAVTYTERRGRRGGEDVHVELTAPPPRDAFAIVLLDDKSKAKSWHQIGGTSMTTLRAYGVSGCIALPNGTRPTKAGDLVRVAFVDDVGRMSAVSAAVKVTAKPSSP
jgi:hypothetical protein